MSPLVIILKAESAARFLKKSIDRISSMFIVFGTYRMDENACKGGYGILYNYLQLPRCNQNNWSCMTSEL